VTQPLHSTVWRLKKEGGTSIFVAAVVVVVVFVILDNTYRCVRGNEIPTNPKGDSAIPVVHHHHGRRIRAAAFWGASLFQLQSVEFVEAELAI
jgi:hypothetical protein